MADGGILPLVVWTPGPSATDGQDQRARPADQPGCHHRSARSRRSAAPPARCRDWVCTLPGAYDRARRRARSPRHASRGGIWPGAGRRCHRHGANYSSSSTCRTTSANGLAPAIRRSRDASCSSFVDTAQPEPATIVVQDSIVDGGRIRERVKAGYIIRTRSDADTVEARTGDHWESDGRRYWWSTVRQHGLLTGRARYPRG